MDLVGKRVITVVTVSAAGLTVGILGWLLATIPWRTEPAPDAVQPARNVQAGTRSNLLETAAFQLETTLAHLRNPADSATVHDELRKLESSLMGLPPAAAIATIQAFLDSRKDVPTRLPFQVGFDGFLADWPSLRVFLLDLLARLDPKAAAACARGILASPTSSDEWAVALRNLAWGDTSPESRALLERKLAEMLAHEPWARSASAGFLEAFDVAVHLGGTNLLAPLSSLLRSPDNPAVAHAAFLALDRMVIQQPAETLAVLQQNPDMMRGREPTRANYFARADVGTESQRALLERYLLDPRLQPSELNVFAGVFPNANYMVSHNLLTRLDTPDGTALTRRDRDALRVVGAWLGDPRFKQLQPQLQQIQQRLQTFVRQAEASD